MLWFDDRAMVVDGIDVVESPSAQSLSMQERIYRKLLAWANRPGSNYAIFLISIIQSAFLPLPLLLVFVTLSLGEPRKAFRFAGICTAGSIIGGCIAYLLGAFAWEAVKSIFVPYLFSEHVLAKVEVIFGGNIYLAVLAASLGPISYQICATVAGMLKVDFWTFLAASCLARPIRFYFFAVLIYYLGDRAKLLIEKHLPAFGWFVLMVAILASALALAFRTLQ